MNKLRLLRDVADELKRETQPDLELPELVSLDKAKVIELIDWELRRIGDSKNAFGVASWSLLVGFAGVTWAFASLPSLASIDWRQMLWAFFLLQITWTAAALIWNLLVGAQRDAPSYRAFKSSMIGGAQMKLQLASGSLYVALLFATSFAWPNIPVREVALLARMVLGLWGILALGALLFVRLDFPLLEAGRSKPKPLSTWFAIACGFLIAVAPLALAVFAWRCVLVYNAEPPPDAIRAGALLVVAWYLLQKVLESAAETRNQEYLENLRRDVAVGFIGQERAVPQLLWRISGLPPQVYVRARLKALTGELIRGAARLDSRAKTLSKAARSCRGISPESQNLQANALSLLLQDCASGETLAKMGTIAKRRALLFLSIAKDQAKNNNAFAEWEGACRAFEAAGTRCSQARRDVEALLHQICGDRTPRANQLPVTESPGNQSPT